MSPTCAWCKKEKEKMTTWRNSRTGEEISLCFRGCQHFPEPFKATEAGEDWANWKRIDPFQDYKRPQPKSGGEENEHKPPANSYPELPNEQRPLHPQLLEALEKALPATH